MQTPPPTSTSASRRKAQQAQLTQQLTTNGGRVPSPGFPKRINPAPALEHSLFPDQSLIHDKFSPDDFSLELSGPVTAPLFPHEHMFWDPNRNDQMDIDFPSGSVTEYQTGPYADTDLALSSRAQARTATLERSQQAMYEDFASSAPTYNEYSKKTASGSEQTGFISAPRLVKKNPTQSKILGTAVDPSLLFSSPGRVSEFVQVPMSTTNTLQDDALQPYAYQIQEAKREGASQGVRKQKKKRKSDIDSPAVKAALQTLREEGINRPGLRRSATDSIVTKEDKVLSRDPKSTLARQITSEKIRRPSSPSKQQQNPAKRKSNYEHSGQRTAITLTIDDSGRARTETKIISDSSEKQLHDAKMTVCIESEGSETESSSDRSGSPIITSQPTSFTYGPHERLKLNRGLFVNDSRCHSQKSSYSSVRTSSSNNSGVTGPGNRGLRAASGLSSSITNTGRPNTSPSDMSVFHMPRTGGVTINPFHSGLGTVVDSQDSNGTAQHELEKVLKVRRQNRSIADAPSNQPRPTESSRHKAFLNHQAEQQPFDFTEAFPFDYDAAQNFYTDVSPTTITDPDLATPSTDYNQSVSSIRCVCHVPETDGHLISW
ncbi:hypothetical protein MMC20_005308 [Loxospora ochrophaea]|nr:hypothetical protein [Loxospora ochrophaea]